MADKRQHRETPSWHISRQRGSAHNVSQPWTTHSVLVVATLDGEFRHHCAPEALANFTLVLMQRVRPSAPYFAPNFGFEAGAFMQFIVTFYENFPNQTFFLQDQFEPHNGNWLQWARCVRPEAAYAPLTHVRLKTKRVNLRKDDPAGAHTAVIEQCYRNFLHAFGLSALVPSGGVFRHKLFQGSSFVASRQQIRRHPHKAYMQAHQMLAGGDGRCHHGELRWAELHTKRSSHSLLLDSPAERGKHTSGGAFEHLQAVIFGGMGLMGPGSFDWCSGFLHKTRCRGSPCPERRG